MTSSESRSKVHEEMARLRRLCSLPPGNHAESDRDDQRKALEQIGDPRNRRIPELKTLDADRQQVEGYQRPHHVEPARLDLGRSEEGGGVRRQQVGVAGSERR